MPQSSRRASVCKCMHAGQDTVPVESVPSTNTVAVIPFAAAPGLDELLLLADLATGVATRRAEGHLIAIVAGRAVSVAGRAKGGGRKF